MAMKGGSSETASVDIRKRLSGRSNADLGESIHGVALQDSIGGVLVLAIASRDHSDPRHPTFEMTLGPNR
jgi:hypothetical protein